jgi:TRAP-type C4-dicarboxylate transport system substrate-binding protein
MEGGENRQVGLKVVQDHINNTIPFRRCKMKIRNFWAIVGMGILVLLLLTKPTMAASDKPVELRAISAWSTNTMITHWYHEYIKEVNERAKKEGLPLTVKNLGGPEIAGTMQQFASMRSGMVDMVYTCGDYFAGETVELSAPGCVRPDPLFFLTALRETKYMDVLREACREKSGCIPLFTINMGRGFTLLSTKSINPGNWSGLKVRSIGGQTAVGIPAMGASSTLIPPAEVFEALQRGTVDGVMGAASDRYTFGERGVYKYILMPRFFEASDYWFISGKAWDGLSENMKSLLVSVGSEMEKTALPWCRKWDDDTIIKYMEEDKVKLVWPSPEEERKLAKAFRWDYMEAMAKKSPKYGAKIFELIKGYIY